MSFISTNIDGTTTNRNPDKLDPSFMYTQIAKEILLTIQFKQQHFNEFIVFCREKMAREGNELPHIEKLQREYRKQTPIWWYTSDCFLYSMLNLALRELDMEIIVNMGFFIVDLHRQIEQLHKKQYRRTYSGSSFILYRGQGLPCTTFTKMQETKGGLLSFNNFLSTSKSRNISLPFARRVISDKDLVGILFVMTVNSAQSTTSFASVTNVSYYGDKEDEVLFSTHTVFRISDIQPMEENLRLFEVHLMLTNDSDKDLHVLAERIRLETFPTSKDGNDWVYC